MAEQKNLMLCFESSNPSDLETALQYWNIDLDGRWRSTVQQIADRIGEPAHRIPAIVRTFATAYDLNVRCTHCGLPTSLACRSDSSYRTWRKSPYRCRTCQLNHTNAQSPIEELGNQVERDRLTKIVQAIASEDDPFDYATIGYLDAILIYGIMLSSPSAVTDGLVGDPNQLLLCPSNSLLNSLLGRLFDRRIILFSDDTSFSAIASESKGPEKFSYYPMKVSWRLARPANEDSFRSVFRRTGAIIDRRAKHPDYNEAVSELWWMLGRDEAIRYLNAHLDLYRLSGFKVGEKMREALDYALTRFSVPQVRNLLWRIAKETAALSTRRDYSKPHALNTIPGSLIRGTDRALAEHWTIKPFCIKWDEEESVLTTMLFDRVLQTGREGFSTATGHFFCGVKSKGENYATEP